MNPISGLITGIVQGTQVQQRQSTDRQRQIRRVQNLNKDSALQGDRLEHQVESVDSLSGSNDGRNPSHARQDQQPHGPGSSPDEPDAHVDFTA